MSEGTKRQTFRLAEDTWIEFGSAVTFRADPPTDRTAVLREFVHWYIGEPGAEMPVRPDPNQ